MYRTYSADVSVRLDGVGLLAVEHRGGDVDEGTWNAVEASGKALPVPRHERGTVSEERDAVAADVRDDRLSDAEVVDAVLHG